MQEINSEHRRIYIPEAEIRARAEVHSVPYWFRNMSSHHVQTLVSTYQDPDSANLLLMFWAVLYGWLIKHENSRKETVDLLCLPQGTLSLYNESVSIQKIKKKQKTAWLTERGVCLRTNAEDLIKNPHLLKRRQSRLEMAVKGVEFEVIEEKRA